MTRMPGPGRTIMARPSRSRAPPRRVAAKRLATCTGEASRRPDGSAGASRRSARRSPAEPPAPTRAAAPPGPPARPVRPRGPARPRRGPRRCRNDRCTTTSQPAVRSSTWSQPAYAPGSPSRDGRRPLHPALVLRRPPEPLAGRSRRCRRRPPRAPRRPAASGTAPPSAATPAAASTSDATAKTADGSAWTTRDTSCSLMAAAPAPCVAARHAGHAAGMRIVVTGATGNVGSQLLPQLLSTPEITSVVGLARRLPAEPDPAVEWHAVDVAEDDLRPLVRGADVVVHLAWLLQPAHDPDEMRRVNVQGSRRVFDAVARRGRARPGARLVRRHVRARPEQPARRREPPAHRHLDLGLQPAQGRGRGAARRPRARPPRAPGRPAAARGRLPGAGRQRARPLLPRPVRAAVAGAPHLLPLLPGRARARDPGACTPRTWPGAYVLAITRPVTGAFNVAAEPVLDPPTLARLLGARTFPLPLSVVAHGRRPDLAAAPAADRPGLGRHRHQGPAHGHHPGPHRAGLDAAGARPATRWSRRSTRWAAAQGGGSPVLRPRATGPARLLEAVRAARPGRRRHRLSAPADDGGRSPCRGPASVVRAAPEVRRPRPARAGRAACVDWRCRVEVCSSW